MRTKTRAELLRVWCFLAAMMIIGIQLLWNVNASEIWLVKAYGEENTYTIKNEENTEATETASSEGPDITSPSAILMEASTGQVIYEKNADESLHPASITKIMTLDLIFDALEEGKITLEQEVTVSEYAASMGGSQVFLEPGEIQTVDTMIKCISVASANDACVAMAELVAGSEDMFVSKMNEKAKELGMNTTTFVNCCGLDIDGHMSSSRDVALMSRDLINRHPQIHDYSSIWMDTITHVTRKGESEFGLSNTNKLIKQYQWATGLKTGSTGLAKCCLSATAEKDGIELIAVIMAAPDSKHRFSDATTLLNYGYSICKIYKDDQIPELTAVHVNKGKEENVNCEYEKEFSYLFMDAYSSDDIKKELIMNEVTAPVDKGAVVGSLNYYYKDSLIGSIKVTASQDVGEAGFADSFFRILKDYTCKRD